MAGSYEGYLKAHKTLLERYGGPEGLKKHRQAIGRLGGLKSKGGGFSSMDPVKHYEASSKGGRHRRLDKSKDDVLDS